MRTNQLVGWFWCRFEWVTKASPLPSPIPELQHAPLPLLMLNLGSMPSSPHNFAVLKIKAHLGSNLGLGSVSLKLPTLSLPTSILPKLLQPFDLFSFFYTIYQWLLILFFLNKVMGTRLFKIWIENIYILKRAKNDSTLPF